MTPADMIYKHTFKLLIDAGHPQSYAGSYAARAVFLWKRGETHDVAIKMAVRDAGKVKKNSRRKAA